MRTTRQLSITLPDDMADVVKAKVRTGEYATESEVIRDGLRVLLARDRTVESWLHDQAGSAYDALKADPPVLSLLTRYAPASPRSMPRHDELSRCLLARG